MYSKLLQKATSVRLIDDTRIRILKAAEKEPAVAAGGDETKPGVYLRLSRAKSATDRLRDFRSSSELLWYIYKGERKLTNFLFSMANPILESLPHHWIYAFTFALGILVFVLGPSSLFQISLVVDLSLLWLLPAFPSYLILIPNLYTCFGSIHLFPYFI